MDKAEIDPLIPPATSPANYQSILRERRKMHHPQHRSTHTHGANNNDGLPAAVAARGSRQLFYRDRIPSQSMLTSDSRDFTVPLPPRMNIPVNTASSDSTDSSEPYGVGGGGGVGLEGHGEGVITAQPLGGGLPPPKQLHADYSHQLHKNQVAQGHHNFVVGGAHGRYRDYGGTLVEVPEEVYAVRKAALTVLDPITYCWVSL